jgi:16S rRNA (adenine1518-N6/adenine1519-N6)-dimethyltransferase
VRPRKRFGQHFLEPAWVDKVVAAVAPAPDDTFLEIGAGRGALTVPLAARVRSVVAVEIDRDLVAEAPRWLPDNVELIEGDVLAIDLPGRLASLPQPVRVVGNLPYNVASPILFMLLDAAGDGGRILDAALMLQREVADRLCAKPGEEGYGVLAVQAGLRADVTRLLVLPPGAFRPAPAVSSALVRLRFRPPGADACDVSTFERIVRGVFLRRRKTLTNALVPVAAALGQSPVQLLARAGIDGARRPETLSVPEFARLARAVL